MKAFIKSYKLHCSIIPCSSSSWQWEEEGLTQGFGDGLSLTLDKSQNPNEKIKSEFPGWAVGTHAAESEWRLLPLGSLTLTLTALLKVLPLLKSGFQKHTKTENYADEFRQIFSALHGNESTGMLVGWPKKKLAKLRVETVWAQNIVIDFSLNWTILRK